MTTTEYSPRARAERVIASGRACLALFALLGGFLAPTDPERLAVQAYHLLTVYAVYAIVIFFVSRREALVTQRATVIQHGVDLAVAVLLALLTRGSGSPFFLFFTFMLLAGTVRWQARGAWTTGLVVIVAYVAVSLHELVLHTEFMDVNRFVVRFGLLSVMTMVLAQLGAYQERLYSELRQLAAWPRSDRTTLDEVLRESLGYATRLLDAPAAALFWQEDDSPLTNVAVYRDDRLERATLPGGVSEFVCVTPECRNFLHDRSRRRPWTLSVEGRSRELPEALPDELVARYDIVTAIGAAFPERSDRGWLVALNRPPTTLTTDDVMLAEIVAADVSASIDHWHLSQRARDAAVAEERLRVSRDLHDGVLQSLTGCRLDIAAAATAAEGTSAQIAALLRGLERSLAHEQQELRHVIQHLRGGRAHRERTPLREVCARVERQWRVAVSVTPDADALIPPELQAPTVLMVHEALANAIRHGKATAAHVFVEQRGQEFVVRIEDDGRGFPFRGRLDGAELAALQTGPRSLRERAELLGGTLAVTSRDTGSIVEIRVPMTREPICA